MKAAVISSSLRGEVGLDVIQALKEKKVFLAADMQGFVRVLQGKSLVYEPWEEMEATLAYLDVLKSDAVEAEYLTGEKDIYKAARDLCGHGTQGDRSDPQGWSAHPCGRQMPRDGIFIRRS